MSSRWRTAGALAFLLALTIGWYWKLTISSEYTWLENPDQALLVMPWLDMQARTLHAGHIPLWDAYLWGGQSLIGQVQPGLVNPVNWVLFALPLQDGHIPIGYLHWYWVLIHWIAAVFCYFLCRDMKAGVGPSLLGAIIFGFAGYIGGSGTPCFLTGAMWTPVVLLFFARLMRGERPVSNAALSGAALAGAFLSANHDVPFYLTVVMGGLWLWYLASNWRLRAAWIAAAAFAVVLLLVMSVQVLPTVEYGRQAVRWAGVPEPLHWKDKIPYSVHAEYSLDLRSIPGMIFPGRGVHAEPFVGIVAIALTGIAAAFRWRTPDVRLLVVVALAGLALALGRDSPIHRLAYEFVPLFDKARYPAQAISIVQAAIAALAALGLDAWLKGVRPRAVPLILVTFALALYAIIRYLMSQGRLPAGHPAWIVAVAALGLAALLCWGRGAPAILIVMALALLEASTINKPIYRRDVPGSLLKTIRDQTDIAAFLKRQPGWFRVQADEDVVPYNLGDLYSIEQFGGYLAAMPAKVHRILGHEPTPRLFGIQYYVGRLPSNPAQVEVFQSTSGLRVFRDPRVSQPLWSVHDRDCGAPDQLSVIGRINGEMDVDAVLACPGLMVSGDPWYRGWRALVDGKKIPIQEFEGVVRAVPISAGHHRIQFRYRPGSVYWGTGLSVLGLFLAGIIRRIDGPLWYSAAQNPVTVLLPPG